MSYAFLIKIKSQTCKLSADVKTNTVCESQRADHPSDNKESKNEETRTLFIKRALKTTVATDANE